MSTRRAKRQGTIEAPRGAKPPTWQQITIGRKTMIVTTYEKDTSVTIFIGSSEIYCIDMQVFKSFSGVEGAYEPQGILTNVRWDGSCSTQDPFERGTDSIMIIQLAMSYLHKYYPDVKQMKFTDLSTRECDNGASVSLVATKMLTDGSTWYESRFHAYINPTHKEIYDDMLRRATEKKRTMTWDTFKRFGKIEHLPMDAEKLYEKSDTWQQFFSGIRDEIGPSKLCIWFSKDGWFNDFVNSALSMEWMTMPFLIDVSSFSMELDPIPMVFKKDGGRRRLQTIRSVKSGTFKNRRR